MTCQYFKAVKFFLLPYPFTLSFAYYITILYSFTKKSFHCLSCFYISSKVVLSRAFIIVLILIILLHILKSKHLC